MTHQTQALRRWLALVVLLTVLTQGARLKALAQTMPGFTAGIQIANLESTSAQITFTLYNFSGEQLGAPVNDTIPANGSKTYFPINDVVSSGCPNVSLVRTENNTPSQTRLVFPRSNCVLVMTGDRQLAGIINLLSEDAQRGGSYVYEGAGATTVYLPLLSKNNSGFNTWFSVINLGSGVANLQVSYSDGTSVSASIAKDGAQSFFQAAETHNQRIFAGTVTSNQPVFASVVMENGEVLFAYAGFRGGATNPVFPIVNANNAGYVTGFQIQNTGTQTTTVEVTYTPTENTGTLCTETQTVGAGASKTFALAAFDNGANSTCVAKQRFIGAARVTGNSANQPLIGLANQLLPGINGGAYSAIDPAQATNRVVMPLIMDRNSGFFTGFSVQNIGNETTEVTCTFANSDVTVAATLQPGQSVADVQSSKLGLHYVGSAICTADLAAAKIVAVVNELGSDTDADQLLVYEGIPGQ